MYLFKRSKRANNNRTYFITAYEICSIIFRSRFPVDNLRRFVTNKKTVISMRDRMEISTRHAYKTNSITHSEYKKQNVQIYLKLIQELKID